jgi:uncharacterized protein YqeY
MKTNACRAAGELRFGKAAAILRADQRKAAMREIIAEALKAALKAGDKRRVLTLRMIQSAIKDRDIANRGTGKEAAGDDDVLQILAKMVKQREESAKAFEDGKRPDLAVQERDEIEIIRAFQPQQLGDEEVKAAASEAIAETGAGGPKDMGRVMAVLKERFSGKMDFGKASAIVKQLLQ